MAQITPTDKEVRGLKKIGKIAAWLGGGFLAFSLVVLFFVKSDSAPGIFGGVFGLLVMVFCVLLYLLPGLVAQKRNHHQRNAIWLLDIFLGWTVLGWVISLVWSASATPNK